MITSSDIALKDIHDLHKLLSKRRTSLYKEVGITPCPYYRVDGRYALFQPFYTANKVYEQGLFNPVYLFIIHALQTINYCIAVPLYFVSFSAALIRQDPDAMFDAFIQTGLALVGIPYTAVHLLVDPLWELLALVTRTGTTLVTYIQDSVDHALTEAPSYEKYDKSNSRK